MTKRTYRVRRTITAETDGNEDRSALGDLRGPTSLGWFIGACVALAAIVAMIVSCVN